MDDFSDFKTNAAPRNNFIQNCQGVLSWSSRFLKQCWIIAVLTVWGAICYLLITHFVFLSIQVDGSSMVPTLNNSEHYWLNRLAYFQSEPCQSDIVVLKDPRDETLIVKRVIGIPGQSIYLHQGKVYVNGKLLDERYLLDKTQTYAFEKNEDEFICIGKNEFFVLGDNRNNSSDSRTFGAVPRQNILGRLIR